MASRKEQKERLKAERVTRQAAARAAERRRRIVGYGVAGALALATAAAVAAVLLSTDGSSGPLDAEGFQVSPPPWPPEYDHLAERLANEAFPPTGSESFHIHVLLSVYVKGKPVTVPANVGFGPAVGEVPLHTHTPDGVVHIEADRPYPFNLGQFFDVWGVKFTNNQLGPYKNDGEERVRAYVDGKALRDPAGHVLAAHDNIVIAYGKPGSSPTRPDASALDDQ